MVPTAISPDPVNWDLAWYVERSGTTGDYNGAYWSSCGAILHQKIYPPFALRSSATSASTMRASLVRMVSLTTVCIGIPTGGNNFLLSGYRHNWRQCILC